REPELEGETDGAELIVAVLTEERHEVVDIAPHRKSSTSQAFDPVPVHPCLGPYADQQHGPRPNDRRIRSKGLRGFGLQGGSGFEGGARKGDAESVTDGDRCRRYV